MIYLSDDARWVDVAVRGNKGVVRARRWPTIGQGRVLRNRKELTAVQKIDICLGVVADKLQLGDCIVIWSSMDHLELNGSCDAGRPGQDINALQGGPSRSGTADAYFLCIV